MPAVITWVPCRLFSCSAATRFQKTESVFKSTAEKTTSILGGFGSGLSMKIGQMRNSDSFKSLEEKMGSAYENVKVGLSYSPNYSFYQLARVCLSLIGRGSVREISAIGRKTLGSFIFGGLAICLVSHTKLRYNAIK